MALCGVYDIYLPVMAGGALGTLWFTGLALAPDRLYLKRQKGIRYVAATPLDRVYHRGVCVLLRPDGTETALHIRRSDLRLRVPGDTGADVARTRLDLGA